MTNFILYVNPEVAIMCLPPGTPAVYSLGTAAHLTGVHPEMLQYYCQLGLLGPRAAASADSPTFDDSALFEIRRIEHCRQNLGVNLQALPLLCDLWREVERLQGELRFHRET